MFSWEVKGNEKGKNKTTKMEAFPVGNSHEILTETPNISFYSLNRGKGETRKTQTEEQQIYIIFFLKSHTKMLKKRNKKSE